MVQKIIELSLRNRLIVLVVAIGQLVYGILEVSRSPIDAIPDLSENQVIVFTEWMGRGRLIIFFNFNQLIFIMAAALVAFFLHVTFTAVCFVFTIHIPAH